MHPIVNFVPKAPGVLILTLMMSGTLGELGEILRGARPIYACCFHQPFCYYCQLLQPLLLYCVIVHK